MFPALTVKREFFIQTFKPHTGDDLFSLHLDRRREERGDDGEVDDAGKIFANNFAAGFVYPIRQFGFVVGSGLGPTL